VLLFYKILRVGVVTEPLALGEPDVIEVAREVETKARRLLGRAVAIREVDAGSCNGCEIEITSLTGPVTRNMEVPLLKTYEATPDPKVVVAVGDCARTCGVFRGSYAVVGSVDAVIPVDVFVSGCPPEPADILRGILTALDRLPQRNARRDGA